jgi:hypothetical protein
VEERRLDWDLIYDGRQLFFAFPARQKNLENACQDILRCLEEVSAHDLVATRKDDVLQFNDIMLSEYRAVSQLGVL